MTWKTIATYDNNQAWLSPVYTIYCPKYGPNKFHCLSTDFCDNDISNFFSSTAVSDGDADVDAVLVVVVGDIVSLTGGMACAASSSFAVVDVVVVVLVDKYGLCLLWKVS